MIACSVYMMGFYDVKSGKISRYGIRLSVIRHAALQGFLLYFYWTLQTTVLTGKQFDADNRTEDVN